MPVEAKPIFRPDVIRLPLLGFSVPDHVAQLRPKLEKWAEIIATGSVDAHKEQEPLGDFINDVFCELLGYARAVDNPTRYTISREKHVQANGKFADAVLGEFAALGLAPRTKKLTITSDTLDDFHTLKGSRDDVPALNRKTEGLLTETVRGST